MAPPDRWENYSNMGRRVPGTRFICFKVPLKNNDEFDLRVLTDHCAELGLVIDLTNTTKYYDPTPLTEHGIRYKKIYTKGHVLPTIKVIKSFFDTVNNFIEKNHNNDKLIGVHCTHGVNRTGYLVCRYMIQLLEMAPDQAISDFDSARGHVQERPLYTDDLRLARWMDENPVTYDARIKADRKAYQAKKLKLQALHTPNSLKKTGNDPNDTTNDSAADDTENDASINNASNTTTPGSEVVADGRRVHRSDSRHIRFEGRSPDSQDDTTPRGTKRRMHQTDETTDGDRYGRDYNEPPPRLNFKRSRMDTRYGGESQQRYDRYYYQQRDGGGPDRHDRHHYGQPGSSKIPDGARDHDSKDLRKYKGPNKRYRSPSRTDYTRGGNDSKEIGLGQNDYKPLTFPDDQSPRRGILDTPTNDRSTRSRRSFGDDEGAAIFSPEGNTPVSARSRRRSKMRFEPY